METLRASAAFALAWRRHLRQVQGVTKQPKLAGGGAEVRDSAEEKPIMIIDGVCNLCERSAQFVIKRDKKGVFRFGSFQSAATQELLRARGLSFPSMDSFVLLAGPRHYTRSDAALRVCQRLDGLWPILSVFLIVPRPIRDAVYNMVARNRYKWFGKKEACLIPTPDIAARFLK